MKRDRMQAEDQNGRLSLMMIAEGLLVGVAAGVTALLYRLSLGYAGKLLEKILQFLYAHPIWTPGWLAVLVLLALAVGFLMKREPLIAGGGIPQAEAEIEGTLLGRWMRVIPAKFGGGFLCILGGLSMGRCGPSIQLGAMAGQGVSRLLKRGESKERSLMACGAGAGLAATFHAPLAGMIFAVEELYKGGDMPAFISVLTATAAAAFSSITVIGNAPIFQFGLTSALPQSYYWMLLPLGILVGAAGAFYSRSMLTAQSLYKKARFLDEPGRMLTVFLTAGVFATVLPKVLGSGGWLITSLTNGEMLLGEVALLLVMKFLFSALCFGSGAPGGNIFPLLTLGAMLGAAFSMIGSGLFGLDPVYLNNFVLLAMAGLFTAVLRTPVTAVVLLFEMSGLVSRLLSLCIVCLTAYIVSELLFPKPMNQILLERYLAGGREGRFAGKSIGEDGKNYT